MSDVGSAMSEMPTPPPPQRTAIPYPFSAVGLDCFSQVRRDDFGVVSHDLGRTVGNLLAVIQHEDLLAEAHDETHVVLDEENRNAVFVPDLPDHAHEVEFLLGVH